MDKLFSLPALDLSFNMSLVNKNAEKIMASLKWAILLTFMSWAENICFSICWVFLKITSLKLRNFSHIK